ncbi:MAG: hypothetical protein EOP82_19450 [Variovorax sp.]|nr:MAG: hypothetical protein EOP82_19450 [Variovorax sp.]
MTERDWEGDHQRLLRSASHQDGLHGLVSVNYWGYSASSAPGRRPTLERALARARWARDGRPTAKLVDPPPTLHGWLQAAALRLGQGDIAEALLAVNQIREFGQMSFGSKVLMAMEPTTCGVYDRVIYEALAEAATADPAWTPYVAIPNSGMSKSKAEVYARWCELLQHRAREMNRYPVGVGGWDYMRDPALKTPWRAADVERAFFVSRDIRVLGSPVLPPAQAL